MEQKPPIILERWLERVAKHLGITVEELCERMKQNKEANDKKANVK